MGGNQTNIDTLCEINIRRKKMLKKITLHFVIVYYTYLPPLQNVKQGMRISERKHDVLETI